MIDLTIDDGYQNILNILRWMGKEKFRPLGIECDRKGEPLPPDHPFFKEFAQLGIGMSMRDMSKERSESAKEPSRFGRLGVLAAEEIAYWDQGLAMSIPGAGLASPPMMLMGTEAQKKRFFDTFEDKETPRWGAFALTEPGAGSDVSAISTTARKDGDHYVLNGEKMFITNGARATWVVAFATTDKTKGRGGHRAFMIEKGTPGFRVGRIEKKMGLASSETASLIFEDCRVPAENLLGGEEYYRRGEGFKGAMGTFDMTRPGVAAMSLGIARAAWESARDHFQEHFPKGSPSRRVALLKEKLGRVKRRLDAGRLLVWRAAWLMDHRQTNSTEAAMAKAFCPPAALEATSLAMEILGEAGARNDSFVEKLFRDIKVFDIFEGTGQVQRIVMARRLVGLPSNV